MTPAVRTFLMLIPHCISDQRSLQALSNNDLAITAFGLAMATSNHTRIPESNKAKKKIVFVSCNGLKNRVSRSVKNYFFLHYFFGVFYACFTLIGSLEGEKNLRVGIFFNKNLLG